MRIDIRCVQIDTTCVRFDTRCSTATHSHHAHYHINQQSTGTHTLVSPPSMFASPPLPFIAVATATTAHCHGPAFAAEFVMAAARMGRMAGRETYQHVIKNALEFLMFLPHNNEDSDNSPPTPPMRRPIISRCISPPPPTAPHLVLSLRWWCGEDDNKDE